MQAISTRQVTKYRFISLCAALGLAAGSLALLAAPASAADGPPAGRLHHRLQLHGRAELHGLLQRAAPAGTTGWSVTPPPCIGVPIGDAHTGSQAIISLYSNTAPVAQPSSASPTPTASGAAPSSTDSAGPTASVSPTVPASPTVSVSPTASMSTASTTALVLSDQQQQILNQAQQLVGTNPMTAGEWYQISGNPYASATAQQKCTNLPPYIWVAQGQQRQRCGSTGLNIPLETLAAARLQPAQHGPARHGHA